MPSCLRAVEESVTCPLLVTVRLLIEERSGMNDGFFCLVVRREDRLRDSALSTKYGALEV